MSTGTEAGNRTQKRGKKTRYGVCQTLKGARYAIGGSFPMLDSLPDARASLAAISLLSSRIECPRSRCISQLPRGAVHDLSDVSLIRHAVERRSIEADGVATGCDVAAAEPPG